MNIKNITELENIIMQMECLTCNDYESKTKCYKCRFSELGGFGDTLYWTPSQTFLNVNKIKIKNKEDCHVSISS